MKPSTGIREELIGIKNLISDNPQTTLKKAIIECHDPVANGTYAGILSVLQYAVLTVIGKIEWYPDLYNAWHHINDFDNSASHQEVMDLLDTAINQ